MKTWRAVLLIAGLGCALTASWLGYSYYVRQPTVFEGPGLKFTASPCESQGVSPPPTLTKAEQWKWRPPMVKEGVESIVWLDDGRLRIVALLVENCFARVMDGGYSVRSGTIYLAYRAKLGDKGAAACNCAYRLTYDIAGVGKGDYDVYFPNRRSR